MVPTNFTPFKRNRESFKFKDESEYDQSDSSRYRAGVDRGNGILVQPADQCDGD